MSDADALAERLRTQVKRLLESVWENRADLKDIDDWLGQFDPGSDGGGGDRLQAFFLLSQFMYFGSFEVRALLKALYRDHFRYPIVARIREACGDTTDLALISSMFDAELSATRFVGLGNPSESSSHLLYYFRQENELPKDLFVGPAEIFHYAAVEDGFVQVIRDNSRLMVSTPCRLRELLAGKTLVQAPGAYDAITARLAAQAGFPCLHTRSVEVPVVADADTGYNQDRFQDFGDLI